MLIRRNPYVSRREIYIPKLEIHISRHGIYISKLETNEYPNSFACKAQITHLTKVTHLFGRRMAQPGLNGLFMGIFVDCSKPKKEEFFISYTSKHCSKAFDFCIKCI